MRIEKPDGAVVQFGGQTAIKLTEAAAENGRADSGNSSAENVDAAEDRELFDGILRNMQHSKTGRTVPYFTAEEAKHAANELGYPVLVRPRSYVLGGQGMQIAISDEDVDEIIGIINRLHRSTQSWWINICAGKKLRWMRYAMARISLIPRYYGAHRAGGHPFRR